MPSLTLLPTSHMPTPQLSTTPSTPDSSTPLLSPTSTMPQVICAWKQGHAVTLVRQKTKPPFLKMLLLSKRFLLWLLRMMIRCVTILKVERWKWWESFTGDVADDASPAAEAYVHDATGTKWLANMRDRWWRWQNEGILDPFWVLALVLVSSLSQHW